MATGRPLTAVLVAAGGNSGDGGGVTQHKIKQCALVEVVPRWQTGAALHTPIRWSSVFARLIGQHD